MLWNNPLNDCPGGFLHPRNSYGDGRKRTLDEGLTRKPAAAPPRKLFGVNGKTKKIVRPLRGQENRMLKGKLTRMLKDVQTKRLPSKPNGEQKKKRERKGREKKIGADRLR
jgi:hypothetical protein